MCLLTAKHHFGLSAVIIFIGFLVVQSASSMLGVWQCAPPPSSP